MNGDKNTNNRSNRRERSVRIKKMVLSAIFSALIIVILFVAGLLGDFDLTVSAFACIIILLAIVEMGVQWGIAIYALTSVISLLLFPSYFITPIYALFVGLYPIVKYFSDKLRKIFSYLIKLAFMNAMLTLLLFIGTKLYALDIRDFTVFGVDLGAYALIITYVLANLALLVFEYCLDKLMLLYNVRLAKVLGLYKLFR